MEGFTGSFSKVLLECKNLLQYLCGLDSALLDRLYEHPATCMAVFRELPDLAKIFVMRTVYVEQPISQTDVQAWVTQEARESLAVAVNAMCDLKIWIANRPPGAAVPSYNMSGVFRSNLQKAIAGGGDAWANTSHLKQDPKAKSKADLEKYSSERWDVLLQFLVGSSSTVSEEVKKVIRFSGLMRYEEYSGIASLSGLVITTKGFQFLLLDKPSQVWYFVLEYLRWAQSQEMELVDMLRFVFEISFTPAGKDLPVEGRSGDVLKCLFLFREVGLLLLRKRSSARFYPTQLATNVVNGASQGGTISSRNGFIIIETNFRIYAYTDSQLQYRILKLFASQYYSFPGCTVMLVTRESIQSAVRNGITAEQILHYIRANAHPVMLKDEKKDIIAQTIADQIRLWAMERDRINFHHGVFYGQFLAQKDFDVLRDYAKEKGCLKFSNSATRTMVVTPEGHENHLKKFYKIYKKNQGREV